MADSTKELLQEIKARYLHSLNSPQYEAWRRESKEWRDFYDGDQWTAEERQILKDRLQPVITINLIAPKIDTVVGNEINNRTQISYRPRTFDAADNDMALALTAYAQQVQETNDATFKNTESFKASLIEGIGWIELDAEDGRILIENPRSDEMVWDIDDTTPQLTNQRYVNRKKWLDLDKAKQLFPGHAEALEAMIAEDDTTITSIADNKDNDFDQDPADQFVNKKLRKVLIVEQQYKVAATKYRYFNEEGRQKTVLDKDEAEKNSIDGEEIEEIKGDKVMFAFFTGSTLLQHGPLAIQTGNFTYQPIVYKRRRTDSIPVGLVGPAIDPQREVNKRRSKMMHYLNTSRIIADSDAFENPEIIREELARPDGVLLKKAGKDVQIQDQLQLADSQLRIMQQAQGEIQQAMGIFDELIGQQTNATSGVAVARRQAASINTQTFAVDQFRYQKRRIGRLLLDLIQATATDNMLINIMGEGGLETARQIEINKPYELNGKTVFEHDITTVDLDVYVEETSDFAAPPEELSVNLTQMIQNGQLEVLVQFPTIMRQMGIRNVEQIQKELAAVQGNAASPAQPEAAPESEAGQTSPTSPTLT
jgi:hypothetical protein